MRTVGLLGACLALVVAGCSGHSSSPAKSAPSSAPKPGPTRSLAATRLPLTTDPASPVAHDTETTSLVAHAGRLFAATGQWMYSGPHPSGQVLVKRSASAPWTVFEQTEQLRVEALDSFPVPADQGLGHGHSLLLTQAVVGGRSEIQWLLDGADSFAPGDAYALPSRSADVRSFGAHEDGGTWSVYAGVEPDGILRGTWSPARHTLVFDPTPELTIAPPGRAGLRTQKVTAFADCAGALYVTINTKLFRRNDGDLPAGVPRWALVYQAPPVGAFNSGLRGLSCIRHDGSPALLASTEGNGDVFRFDHLPTARIDDGSVRLAPVLELAPVPAIRSILHAAGVTVPTGGRGSIAYVIAAYNDFTTLRVDDAPRQLFGFEWAYAGGCAPGRTCGPTALRGATFDAAACFAVRTDDGASLSYALRCLGGPDLTPTGNGAPPIRGGQAFVSIRTIRPSPFDDGRLYFGGYDCNFYPADGTAWTATAPAAELRLTGGPHARAP